MRPTTHEISVETTSFKDTQLDLRRNEEFQLPEEWYKMLRKWMSVSFVMRGFSNTDIFRAWSFGTSSKKEKLISEYEKIYTLDRKGKVLRRRTERKVTNIDLIIQAEMSVSLQISERRKIIVISWQKIDNYLILLCSFILFYDTV